MSLGLQRPVIGVSYLETMPRELIEPFLSEVGDQRVAVAEEVRPDLQMFASAEWFIPTAIFLFFSKSYFEGFLQAAGADHYQRLQKSASSLMTRLSLIRVTYLASGRKIKEDNPFTGAISLVAEGREDGRFKLLFKKDADEAEIALSVSAFLEFLKSYHNGGEAAELIKDFGHFRAVGGLHLVYYDSSLKKLRSLDPRG